MSNLPLLPHHCDFTSGRCPTCGCRSKWPDARRSCPAKPLPATDGKPRPGPAPRATTFAAYPCAHRGVLTGETVGCDTCGAPRQMPVATCAIHERCIPTRGKNTSAMRCDRCGDRA